jgi:hypothetical protein
MNGKGQGKAAGISNKLALLQATKSASSKSHLWFCAAQRTVQFKGNKFVSLPVD